jgi:hypothetical protein
MSISKEFEAKSGTPLKVASQAPLMEQLPSHILVQFL